MLTAHLPLSELLPSQWLSELFWPLQNRLERGEEISTWTRDKDQSQAGLSCWLLHVTIPGYPVTCVYWSASYHAHCSRANLAWPLCLVMAPQRRGRWERTREAKPLQGEGWNLSRSHPSTQVSGFLNILTAQTTPKFSDVAQGADVGPPACWRGRCSGQWAVPWGSMGRPKHTEQCKKWRKISIFWHALENNCGPAGKKCICD